MKLPEEYWSCVERHPIHRYDSGEWASLHRFGSDAKQVLDLISSTHPDRQIVWRGQADADFGLSSSLFRKALELNSMHELSERRLADLENDIILYARDCGLGRGMTNLELLRALQHYQIPTRLIDVSREPLSATWFACSGMPRKDGRLFLFAVPAASVRKDDPTLRMVPWRSIPLLNWTNKVLMLDASPSNPRMAAQSGSFLVGGLARCYPGQQRLAKDRHGRWLSVPPQQIHEISEIFVKFPKQLTRAQIARWNASETYGVTWRIPKGTKPKGLALLRRIGIETKAMYPDFDDALEGLDRALRLC